MVQKYATTKKDPPRKAKDKKKVQKQIDFMKFEIARESEDLNKKVRFHAIDNTQLNDYNTSNDLIFHSFVFNFFESSSI